MISVKNVVKQFAASHTDNPAVDDVSFDVPRGLVYALLGPSGCGKTTLLRCLAGIETPDSGEISIDGRAVFSSTSGAFVPVHKRGIGMVFQSYAIWPHMSVYENVAYPLRYGAGPRLKKVEVEARVRKALALVQLEAAIDRSATTLSGGQQQRVALARAIVHEPTVLLMDEPLSNLDARLRQETRRQLAELHKALGTTTVYVTHDQVEAMALADVVAVMRDGKILQAATPIELYDRPVDRFVANFIGEMNWIDGQVRGRDADGLAVDTALGTLACAPGGPESGDVVVGVRPLSVKLRPAGSNGVAADANRVSGEIVASIFLGDATSVSVRVGDQLLEVYLVDRPGALDGKVELVLPREACLVYAR